MEIFISHKQEDEFSARRIATVCRNAGVGYYLDVLDDFTFEDAESLTNHIHEKLNDYNAPRNLDKKNDENKLG